MVSFGTFLPKPCLFAVRWQNCWFSRLLGDDISDILVPGLWGGVSLLSFVLFFNFQYLSGRPSCAFFDIAHFDILNEIFKVRSVRRLPDVTFRLEQPLIYESLSKVWGFPYTILKDCRVWSSRYFRSQFQNFWHKRVIIYSKSPLENSSIFAEWF